MNRVVQSVACLFILVTSAQTQQIASADLSHPKAPAESAEKQFKTELPKGCEKLSPGAIFDGAVLPPNHEPREIVVQMVKLSNENPVLGSELQGEVELRNSGKYSINIPWSAGSNSMERAFPVINPCQ